MKKNLLKRKSSEYNLFSKKNKGFTLVEIMISLGIFTIVAVVAVGALLKITNANRKSITLKTAINNLNFALESMSREMRMGSNYMCGPYTSSPTPFGCNNSLSGNWVITFNSSKGCTYGYRYDGATIEKSQNADSSINCGISDYIPLISPQIIITDSIINVNNSNQPKVFIWLKGYSKIKEKDKTEFSIQTTISQRLGI